MDAGPNSQLFSIRVQLIGGSSLLTHCPAVRWNKSHDNCYSPVGQGAKPSRIIFLFNLLDLCTQISLSSFVKNGESL